MMSLPISTAMRMAASGPKVTTIGATVRTFGSGLQNPQRAPVSHTAASMDIDIASCLITNTR